MSNRFNQQDRLAKDKIEVSSFLIYKKEYRELSNDAKVMYQYLLKRFSVSEVKLEQAMEENTMENFSFLDENNDLFCFCSNDELRFVLNISEPTVKKCKKELAKVGLLEEVKQTAHKTNKLYVNKVVMDEKVKAGYHQDLLKFKTEESEKRKAKNAKRNTVKSSEPKNIKFTEPKNLGFMNQKIFGHSTKEELSTKESSITKELKSISLTNNIDSELNEITEMPMLVKKQISANQKRLIDDNISPFEILAFYSSTDNTVTDGDFALLTGNVLKKTKGKIGNFHNVMKKAIKNHYDEYEADSEEVSTEEFWGLNK